jgi:hypothetical protein
MKSIITIKDEGNEDYKVTFTTKDGEKSNINHVKGQSELLAKINEFIILNI